jgi:hypothetical protein
MPSTQTNAQSLRVIGQALETLRINAFILEKQDEKIVVSEWEPSFLEGIAAGVWGKSDVDQMHLPPQRSAKVMIYTNSDTERLDAQGRSKRRSTGSADAYTMSSGLRALGDYFDKKRSVAFKVFWSSQSVKIRLKTAAGTIQETSFTPQELQDLAVGMYLRRSNRQAG